MADGEKPGDALELKKSGNSSGGGDIAKRLYELIRDHGEFKADEAETINCLFGLQKDFMKVSLSPEKTDVELQMKLEELNKLKKLKKEIVLNKLKKEIVLNKLKMEIVSDDDPIKVSFLDNRDSSIVSIYNLFCNNDEFTADEVGTINCLFSLRENFMKLSLRPEKTDEYNRKLKELKLKMKIVSKNGYCYIRDFSEGYAVVKKGGFCGLVNKKRKEVISPTKKYTYLSDVKGGRLFYSEYECSPDRKYGLMTVNGKSLRDQYLNMPSEVFDNGSAVFLDKLGYIIMDEDLKFISLKKEYDNIKRLGENFYILRKSKLKEVNDCVLINTSNYNPLINTSNYKADDGKDDNYVDVHNNLKFTVGPGRYCEIYDLEELEGKFVAKVSKYLDESYNEGIGLIIAENGAEVDVINNGGNISFQYRIDFQ